MTGKVLRLHPVKPRVQRRMPSVFTDETTRWLMLEAILRRRMGSYRNGNEVTVVYPTDLEAEQYQNMLRRTRRNAVRT